MQQIINKFVAPLFAVKEQKRTFLYEKVLFSAVTIDKFSDMFRFLFNKVYMILVLVVTLISNVYFFFFLPMIYYYSILK